MHFPLRATVRAQNALKKSVRHLSQMQQQRRWLSAQSHQVRSFEDLHVWHYNSIFVTFASVASGQWCIYIYIYWRICFYVFSSGGCIINGSKWCLQMVHQLDFMLWCRPKHLRSIEENWTLQGSGGSFFSQLFSNLYSCSGGYIAVQFLWPFYFSKHMQVYVVLQQV